MYFVVYFLPLTLNKDFHCM